jgi:hypothetical protein
VEANFGRSQRQETRAEVICEFASQPDEGEVLDTSKEQAGDTEGDRSFSHVCDVSDVVNEQLL